EDRTEHEEEQQRIAKAVRDCSGHRRAQSEGMAKLGHPADRLECSFTGDGARNAGDILDTTGQPVLILENGKNDLGNAKRCDREIVGPQTERHLADKIGRSRRESPAHRPGNQNRQPETAKIALYARIDRLYRIRCGIKKDPHDDVAGKDREERRPGPPSSVCAATNEDGSADCPEDGESGKTEIRATGYPG